MSDQIAPQLAPPAAAAVAGALAALLPTAPATADSLASVLSAVQALTSDARGQLFADANSASTDATQLRCAIMRYFLDDAHSGSATDAVCQFLYDSYWEASTKQSAVALPTAHLFVLNLLPVMVYKFMSKHFGAIGLPAASTAPYAGLFTVFLAIYNTERIRSARGGAPTDTRASDREALKKMPEIKNLPATDLSGRPYASPSTAAQQLPSVLEPSQHTLLLLHVLLQKMSGHLAVMRPDAVESLVYLIGLATSSGQAGDIFEAARGESTPQWPTAWRGANAHAHRFLLSTPLLVDFLHCLSYALALPTATADSSARSFALVSLRQVHCRAVEEMLPEVLLQTMCMLQQEEARTSGTSRQA